MNNKSVFFLLFSVIYIFTYGYTRTYFQQDEFGGFGTVISLSNSGINAWITGLVGVHFVPFANLIWLLLYRLFGYESQYYVATSILLHTTASFLVYLFVKALTKKSSIALLTSILFATNSRAAQTFTHLSIFPSTITSFIFIVLFFFLLVTKKDNVFRISDFFVYLSIFFCSVFFREDAFVIVPLFVLFVLFFKWSAIQKKNLWFFMSFFVITTVYFVYRFFLQTHDTSIVSVGTKSYLHTYIYNALTIPFKLVSQNIFDVNIFYNFIWYNRLRFYGVDFSQPLMDTMVIDFVLWLIFSIVVFLLFTIKIFISYAKFKNVFMLSCSWIIISAFLLASVGRPLGMIEPRYLYLSSFAVFLFMSCILYLLWNSKSKPTPVRFFLRVVVIFIFGVILFTSYISIQDIIKRQGEVSQVRKKFLVSVLKVAPHLDHKVIFYIKCKSECFSNSLYGLPNDLVLPFSSGSGWVLLLQYAKTNEKAYGQFFLPVNGKYFLWDMGAQGYKEMGGYGFGYFTDMNLLQKTLGQYKNSKIQIIGLEYDDKMYVVRDISQKIQINK